MVYRGDMRAHCPTCTSADIKKHQLYVGPGAMDWEWWFDCRGCGYTTPHRDQVGVAYQDLNWVDMYASQGDER